MDNTVRLCWVETPSLLGYSSTLRPLFTLSIASIITMRIKLLMGDLMRKLEDKQILAATR